MILILFRKESGKELTKLSVPFLDLYFRLGFRGADAGQYAERKKDREKSKSLHGPMIKYVWVM